MDKDIADVRVTIKVRHMYAIIITVVSITSLAVIGWYDLKVEARDANSGVTNIEYRVERLECLMEQANDFRIYGIKPKEPCVKARRHE